MMLKRLWLSLINKIQAILEKALLLVKMLINKVNLNLVSKLNHPTKIKEFKVNYQIKFQIDQMKKLARNDYIYILYYSN